MSAFSVKVDLGVAQKKLAELVSRVANVRPALLEVRELLLESTQRRFVDEKGPDGTPWLKLSKKTLAGQKKKASRFPLGILKQSGQLAENVSGDVTGQTLTIGSPEVYSAIQQFGGTAGLGSVIPSRPFLGISDQDRDGISSIFEDHLSPD